MKNKISLQSYENHTLENNRLSNPIKLTNLKFNNLAIFLYDMWKMIFKCGLRAKPQSLQVKYIYTLKK